LKAQLKVIKDKKTERKNVEGWIKSQLKDIKKQKEALSKAEAQTKKYEAQISRIARELNTLETSYYDDRNGFNSFYGPSFKESVEVTEAKLNGKDKVADASQFDVTAYINKKLGLKKTADKVYFDGADLIATIPALRFQRADSAEREVEVTGALTDPKLTVDALVAKVKKLTESVEVAEQTFKKNGYVDINWVSDHLPAVEAGKKMNVKVNKISGKEKLRMKGKGKDIQKLLLSLGWNSSDIKRVVTEAKDDVKFTPAEYKLIEKFAQKNLSVDGYVHVEGEYMITISNEVGEGRAAVRNSTYVKKVGPGTSNGFHQYVVSTGSELVSRSRWPLPPKNKKAVAFSEPFEGTSDLKELNRVLTKAVK